MSQEIKSIICEMDPQEVAFQEAVRNWVSGNIDYNQVMEKYPSYLLRPHERIARVIKQTVGKLRNLQH